MFDNISSRVTYIIIIMKIMYELKMRCSNVTEINEAVKDVFRLYVFYLLRMRRLSGEIDV